MKNDAKTLSVADRLEIHELLARYYLAEDSALVDPWVSAFTKDGGFYKRDGQACLGHDELRRFALKRQERPEAREYVHWTSNLLVTPTEDGAQLQYYSMTVQQTADGYRIRGMAINTDELRQENGQWRFKSRRSVSCPAGESGSKVG